MNVAILGTGNIGMDILMKVLRSHSLTCTHFVGRNADSTGIAVAQKLGVAVSTHGIDALLKEPQTYDLVFDATSASSHIEHFEALSALNKKMINLTPAKIGKFCVPSININDVIKHNNINMITCGGQAAIPIIHAMTTIHKKIEYIEVVSSISSKSAGIATRDNLDEYLMTTENAIKAFSSCMHAKAILNINPAVPEVNMKTTIMATIKNPQLPLIEEQMYKMIDAVKQYVPSYSMIVPPHRENNRIITMIQVVGAGDFLPSYAGNLDIITSAAVTIAELMAIKNNEHINY